VGNLNANTTTLRSHAGVCEGLAADLGAGTAPPCPGTFRPTAATVAALHESVRRARTALIDRMSATATAVHATAAGFDAEEQGAADRMGALAP
jgi:hypothetical protein